MKILVLQLARLGDLYQTWPVARALRRTHPEAEIVLLARSRFASAAASLESIDRAIALPSRDVLAPLLSDVPELEAAASAMEKFVGSLRADGFGLVVNLSFSPLSSFLACAVGAGEARGYSRHADGHLAIPDDASAYFYAQAGPGRSNRINLTEIFAQAAGVELAAEDWRPAAAWKEALRERARRRARSHAKRALLHVGASDARKTLSPAKWAGVARELLKRKREGFELALVGAPSERAHGDAIVAACGDPRLENLVGQTDVAGLEREVASADLLIGGDSGPMQIASLAGTPALCLSFPSVSLWETGPRSAASRALPVMNENDVGSDAIADEALRILEGVPSDRPGWISQGPLGPWLPSAPDAFAGDEFGWRLLQAIYMGQAFPAAPDAAFSLGCRRFDEANELALEQLRRLRASPSDTAAASILSRADDVFSAIARLEPRLAPLARWLETERLRVGPGPFDGIAAAYLAIHLKLSEILRLYDPRGARLGDSAARLDEPKRPPLEGASNGS